jgi:hypothetical protein
MRRSSLLVLTALLVAPGAARAQSCFRPRPKPSCERFWIAELNIERRRGTLHDGRLPPGVVFGSGALGGMSNISPRWALGGAFVVVTPRYVERENGGKDWILGMVVRARRWLGRDVSLDVTAGAWRLRALRPTVEIAVEAGGLAALIVGARGDRPLPRRGEVYVGVRLESEAALAGVAAWMLGIIVALENDGGT